MLIKKEASLAQQHLTAVPIIAESGLPDVKTMIESGMDTNDALEIMGAAVNARRLGGEVRNSMSNTRRALLDKLDKIAS